MSLTSLLVRLLSICFLFSATVSSYTLRETYQGSNFFDKFNFFTGPDPTHGFVTFVDRATAQSRGLISSTSTTARLNVDNYRVLSRTGPGRQSVRIESKNRYTRGLFIVDVRHMPGQACGIWPAFWTLGSGTWPTNGEIDIIEGVNRQSGNLILAHTSNQCSINGQGQLGTSVGNNCAVSFSPTGCGVKVPDTRSYGSSFNNNGGGVYAMQWTSQFIKVWFFPRGSIPSTLSTTRPDVSRFGTPQAVFQGACIIDQKFRDHRLIFDTTFCGDFAGNTYRQNGCPMYNMQDQIQACVRYVAETPGAYRYGWWEINSIKIYQP